MDWYYVLQTCNSCGGTFCGSRHRYTSPQRPSLSHRRIWPVGQKSSLTSRAAKLKADSFQTELQAVEIEPLKTQSRNIRNDLIVAINSTKANHYIYTVHEVFN